MFCPPVRIALNRLHGRDELVFGFEQRPAIGFLDNLGKRSKPPRDHRRTQPETFDQDNPKRLIANRRHDQTQRAAIIGGQLIQRFASEKFDARIVRRLRLELFGVIAIAEDEEVRIGIIGEGREYVLQAFDFFEPPDKQKVGPVMLGRVGLSGRINIRQEVRQHCHLVAQAKFLVLLA